MTAATYERAAPIRAPAVPWREVLIAAGLTALVGGLLLALGPAPGDAPAHLYRTLLVRDGSLVWDNLWYAGQYPLASYSLLYYLPAAVLGNLPLVLVAAVASAMLFAAIGYDEWGPLARWPSRVFGVLAAAPLFTGLYSYTLGFATLLAALRVLQRGRTWLAVVFAALTLGFSPLAFVFLCLILFALLLARRRVTIRTVGLVAGLFAVAGVELAAVLLFPSSGVYPFNPADLFGVLAVCSVGTVLSVRGGQDGRLIASFFVVWGGASLFSYLVPNAVGDNATRLRSFVFPLMLVAAAQARFRPRLLTVVALAGALAYNLVPYLMLIPYRLDARPAHATFWRPAIAYLDRHRDPNYRIEVVPTAAHWESYWLPRAGYPLARGWYRQLDMATSPVLYRPHLTGTAYRVWLRSMGVRYVLLPSTELDPVGAPKEAKLLRSGAAGLQTVYSSRTWTIYELPRPSPLLTGPAPAHLTEFGHEVIAGVVFAPGRYRLRVRFNPYWKTAPGICLRPSKNGMTQLVIPWAGAFVLAIPNSFDGVLDSLVRSTDSC